MSTDLPNTRPHTPFEEQQTRLAKGREFLSRTDVSGDMARMWTGSARATIRSLFGADSPQDRAWPMMDKAPPPNLVHKELGERVAILERMVYQVAGAGLGPAGDNVFIGHGRSPLWRELKDFLQERLHLRCDEFNREAVAGATIAERLEQMLKDSAFALLVMTAEDQHADQLMHARENVVHEVGLFQGHLGFKRAIVLLERGCTPFSNIHGLIYISFPPGEIKACFEEVRAVLEREGLVRPIAPK